MLSERPVSKCYILSDTICMTVTTRQNCGVRAVIARSEGWGSLTIKGKKIPEGILGSNGIALYPDSSGIYSCVKICRMVHPNKSSFCFIII